MSGTRRAPLARAIVAGGVMAAVDGLAAVVLGLFLTGLFRPIRTLQGIAAGVLGRATFDGGLATAALGLACHLVIAYAWTLAYLLVFQRWSRLRRAAQSAWGTAAIAVAIGTIVWLGMNLVIVPLSSAAPTPLFSGVWFALLAIHWVAVGLPIAAIVR
jgi:hypothetical protein